LPPRAYSDGPQAHKEKVIAETISKGFFKIIEYGNNLLTKHWRRSAPFNEIRHNPF
jgi:hypothetical protein